MSLLTKTAGLSHGLLHHLGCVLASPWGVQPPPGKHSPAPRSRLDSEGVYQATFVLSSLPMAAAKQSLPPQLEPAPQALTPPGRHPLMFVFGEQRHVRPIIHRGPGLTYREFITVVPFVQWTDHRHAYRGPFAFLPRLFLDSWFPVLLGWMVGFAKRQQRVDMAAGKYRISHSVSQQPIVEVGFQPRGPVALPQGFPLFAPVQDIFDLPLITRLAFGPFLAMDFEWHLDTALMQAVAADVQIHESYLPGLPVGPFHAEGIDQASLGAFSLEVPWTLYLPVEPSSLRP